MGAATRISELESVRQKLIEMGEKEFMNKHELFVIGRCLIAVMFMASALGKVSNWRKTVNVMQLHHLPFPSGALAVSVAVEFTGAICLIIGRLLYPAVFALFTFIVVATVAVPLQDAVNGEDRDSVLPIIGSNMAILGALLLVLVSHGL